MKMKKECTHFSALMMHYISTRNVRIADLAAYCHYDRATLYQIIRGKRAPVDQAQVKQFVTYLKLNLAQQEELFGAYYECLYGSQAYRTHFRVMDFFKKISALREPSSYPIRIEGETDAPYEKSRWHTLESRGEVNAALFNAITREVRRGNGRVTVIAQSDCDDLFQILGQFAGETDLAITHLICLDNSGSLERQRYYNLNSMERCISLFLQHSHYQALYYYDNVAARFDAFSMFPFMVMTAEGVVTFDVQCECGFYHQDADAVAQFFRKAQRLKASALPFFEDIGGLEEEFKVLSQCHFVQYVEAVPFVIPLLNERMLKQALTMDTGLDDPLVQMIHQYLRHARIQSDQQETWIFTEEGLDYFAETGRITAVPDAFYKALPLEDRVTLLRGVLRMVDNERFRMLLPSIGPMNLFFETYIARDAVYFLHCDEGNGELHFYCTREAMLVNLFSQFVSRMEAYGELCTKEQSHGDQPVSGKVECSGNRSF